MRHSKHRQLRLKAFHVIPLTKREIFDSVIKYKRDDRAVGTLQFHSLKLIKCFRCGGVLRPDHVCPALLCETCFGTGHEQCAQHSPTLCWRCGFGRHADTDCFERPGLEHVPPEIRCVRCGTHGHIDCRNS